jgi:hypothetical protein
MGNRLGVRESDAEILGTAAIGRRDSFEPSARQGFEEFVKGFCGPESPICDLRVAQWATYALPGTGLIERLA